MHFKTTPVTYLELIDLTGGVFNLPVDAVECLLTGLRQGLGLSLERSYTGACYSVWHTAHAYPDPRSTLLVRVQGCQATICVYRDDAQELANVCQAYLETHAQN